MLVGRRVAIVAGEAAGSRYSSKRLEYPDKAAIPGDVDEWVGAVQAALRELPQDRERSEACLKPLAVKLPAATKRVSLSRTRQLAIYRRDHFTCRYCERPTVLHAVLEYVAKQFPQALPYHPYWKRSETHPMFYDITTSCEHVVAVARGGNNDDSNLVAACARCQYIKSDRSLEEMNWTRHPPPDSDWDGLAGPFLTAFKANPVEDQNLASWATELDR